MSRYGRFLWQPKSEVANRGPNFDGNHMNPTVNYNESTASHHHGSYSSRVASIVDAVDDEHSEPSGRYTQFLKNDTSNQSQLSQKLLDSAETVKKLIEERKKEKMDFEFDYHEKEEISDIEMKMDPEQFMRNRRSSQEFQTLVWNALNADWMMELDNRFIKQNADQQQDIQVSDLSCILLIYFHRWMELPVLSAVFLIQMSSFTN
jgi:homoserine trans-succinylase